MKIYITLIHEIPFVHDMMERLDLTERGSKVYVKFRTMEMELHDESEDGFQKIIEAICFKQYEELQNPEGIGKPVFQYGIGRKTDGIRMKKIIPMQNDFDLLEKCRMFATSIILRGRQIRPYCGRFFMP